MAVSSDHMCFLSDGIVKLTIGNMEWQCSRDFGSKNTAVSHLQEISIFREFLKKQDEAMSLFIEGLLQKDCFPDVLHSDHNTSIRHDTDEKVTKTEITADRPEQVGAPIIAVADQEAQLNVKPEANLVRQIESTIIREFGVPDSIVRRLESFSDWWVNFHEPQRTSRLAKFVNGLPFQLVVVTVILLNTGFFVYTANYEMKHLTEVPEHIVAPIEWCFITFYTWELILRIYIHGWYFFVNDNCWGNIFDVFIVLVSCLSRLQHTLGAGRGPSISFFRLLRTIRGVKAVRMFRVLRMFRDLRVMLSCIYGSFQSLFWCLALLVLIMLVFAIFFVMAFASYLLDNDVPIIETEYIEKRFGSVERAILTLYKIVTGMIDGEAIYTVVEPTGVFNSLVLLLLVGFYQIALINILTGIFVEKAMQSAQPERDMQVVEHRLDAIDKVAALRDLCQQLKLSQHGIIQRDTFMNRLRDPNVRFAFEVEGLQIQDAQAFFDLLHSVSGSDSIEVDTFVASCLRLRGFASTIDLYILELKLINSIAEVSSQIEMMRSRSSNPTNQTQDAEVGRTTV